MSKHCFDVPRSGKSRQMLDQVQIIVESFCISRLKIKWPEAGGGRRRTSKEALIVGLD